MQFAILSVFYILAALILFYSLRTEFRLYILCAASIIYPFLLGQEVGTAIIVISLTVYGAGLLIDYLNNIGQKKVSSILMILTITMIVGIMVLTKYFSRILAFLNAENLFVNSIPEDSFLFSVCIPIGFSFYGFQAISYILDVYNGKKQAERNILLFHIYMAWFPKFISGPIERSDEFIHQLRSIDKVRIFDAHRIKKSASYIFIGCFYKMVVADRIAPLIKQVFLSPGNYSRAILIIVAILFTIQIYCDFAGYSMFAIGVSELFGIRLTENFNAPYLSHNINEFWERWHISLSRWLKQYIYIPLGGNRKGIERKYLNIMIVFLISGIWHGAGWGFIIWGLLHGTYSVIDNLILRSNYTRIREGFIGRFITFTSVSFAWIFFYNGSVSSAINYIKTLLITPGELGIINQLVLIKNDTDTMVDLVVLLAVIIIILVFDMVIYKKTLLKMIENMSLGSWCLMIWILILLVAVFGVYGPDIEGNQMIYMQF
ncbi:MAG: MBOAT family protein [Lachnospiraceae bacterium]|nr:MBOAT family protein [Lachnospiraceae bacterium]